MSACPRCQSQLQPLPEVYEIEVRKVDVDLERLGRMTPPTSRSAIHGFIMGVLIWMSLLVPFFVVGHFWRTCLPVWAATVLWVGLFVRARKQDRELKRVYGARQACAACGWTD
ncbi:MAG TPA: hypothetical protein VJ623_09165 [Holophagaceae bacterium]|nr:hypothetical protein [Holophagaceae bacterium]